MIKRIVSIWAGTGQAAILKWLVGLEGVSLTALVTTTDNGGSSAMIRESLDIPSPGDVRNVINAINPKEGILSQLLNFRFTEWDLAWLHVGNLIVGALSRLKGDYLAWIEVLNERLRLPARILPVSNHDAHICAELEDGTVLEGEWQIIKRAKADVKIARYFLSDASGAVQEGLDALHEADMIVICPGVLGTGIISTLLFDGMKQAITDTDATLVYFANAMTYPSQTDFFSLSDHVQQLEEYTGRKIDVVVANNGRPPEDIIENYASSGSALVAIDEERLADYQLIVENLLIDYDADHNHTELNRAQWVGQHVGLHYIRHDSARVARIVQGLL